MSSLKLSIESKFPCFDEQEQLFIYQILTEASTDIHKFNKAKEQFLHILFRDLVEFYQWNTPLEQRIITRKRFFNAAGLFAIIPIEDLRRTAHKARLTQKKIVHEAPMDPLKKNYAELHAYDLKYLEPFNLFLGQISLAHNMSALDYIAGNRDKRHYPRSQYIVFRKNVQEEVVAQEFLTASAEPLTQTQIISIYDPQDNLRDLMTVGFDLVYESAFIDFFHHAPNVNSIRLIRNANIMGNNFLSAAMDRLTDAVENRENLAAKFPIFLGKASHDDEAKLDNVILFVTKQLVPAIFKKVRECNQKLGLDPDNMQVDWS